MRLIAAIAQKMNSLDPREVKANFAVVSDAYRSHQPHRVTLDSRLLWSYVAGRMPATYAVVRYVLQEWMALGARAPKTVLDVGAGPATASFAIAEIFENVSLHLIEKEKSFREIAVELAHIANIDAVTNATWTISDAKSLKYPQADLAIASYSLGELLLDNAISLAKSIFANVETLIVIEPGTPQGFARTKALRESLLRSGALIAAPCPHQNTCPMRGEDFCHFSQRVKREKFHRDAKSASLPFEDEKFSYAIFTKSPLKPYDARIIKRPMKGSGHITLDLCTNGEIERSVVARSNKDSYKFARKAEWGDRF